MSAALRNLPSVDRVLATEESAALISVHGRQQVTGAIRAAVDALRQSVLAGAAMPGDPAQAVLAAAAADLDRPDPLRPCLNLTGTILHTNLGRALLPEEAVQAAADAMRSAVALEYDLISGGRGERDDHLRGILRDLTGAADATIVNNNAAAVLLSLNSFASGREAVVSRGELIEIGGAFRIPDIMARAGAKLVEIGTTNRTHPKDYRAAIGPETGIVLKVHCSNYRIEGFTREVGAEELAGIAHEAGVPLMNDLGSGSLIDMSRFGLRQEPTVEQAVSAGADLVTFSGDKLLGGPQAGFIVGSADLIAQINRNPMKRAMRLDKIRIAALSAVLKLYLDPDRLILRLPTLRMLSRQRDDITAQATRLCDRVAERISPLGFRVAVCDCESQVGSGALPTDTLPSAGLALTGTGRAGLVELAAKLRDLAVPVIARISDGALILDLRALRKDGDLLTALEGLSH
ncbi:L-seryl-tRNA(Sec) selenium transferase [Paracoccus aerodenitrificans]|uniref:L-seryl-tRNA(Sec) selenium transferase n=1 Tax=Paracoccus aerodenitrificans TaxID=3017781 RepID=UPI0022F0E9ED|nr:L-seryl-tRNA(Sec) selenium transferase [Paracoccus aerodenitrificans]WBU65416.1 L-seryl-tRNA(Sec) selenium transferase [Paracoccus aerodenitrificans]